MDDEGEPPIGVAADPMGDADWEELLAARELDTAPDEVGPGDAPAEDEASGWGDGLLGALADGGALDAAVPCGTVAVLAELAAGAGIDYPGADDDQLIGAVQLWNRIMAWAAGHRYRAIGRFLRHRPGAEPTVPGGLPPVWDEWAGEELAFALACGPGQADALLGAAHDLEAKLPGTARALLAGAISEDKAGILVRGTMVLDPAQARQAERLVLDRAGELTPGGLRSAVRRAVAMVDPEGTARRREAAARTRRVEVRPEESGNSSVTARELSPELAAAIDADLSARARELKKAGIGNDSQDRRVLALLERFGLADLPSLDTVPGGVAVPAKLTLTVPLDTLQSLRDAPGELASHGAVDAALARTLGQAALRHPATRTGVIVTGPDGTLAGYGKARPATRSQRDWYARYGRLPRAPRTGPGLVPWTADPSGGQRGYGTWLLDRGNGLPLQAVTIGAVTTDPCDHRLATEVHDPGEELKQVVQLRYRTCTSPDCLRPAAQCDWEHSVPHERGGITCCCNGNPKCRRHHKMKQQPHWEAAQHPDGRIEWRTPAGRTRITRPHEYAS